MSLIVLSTIISEITQPDGRIDVAERHTYSSGEIYDISYLAAPELDFQAVANARAANINAKILGDKAVLAEAMNFEVPLQMNDIIKRVAMLGVLPAFLSSTDPAVATAQIVFNKWSGLVYRADPLTIAMFDAIKTAGFLTDAQVAQVLA